MLCAASAAPLKPLPTPWQVLAAAAEAIKVTAAGQKAKAEAGMATDLRMDALLTPEEAAAQTSAALEEVPRESVGCAHAVCDRLHRRVKGDRDFSSVTVSLLQLHCRIKQGSAKVLSCLTSMSCAPSRDGVPVERGQPVEALQQSRLYKAEYGPRDIRLYFRSVSDTL